MMDHESAAALGRTVGAVSQGGGALAGAAGVLLVVYLALIVISIVAAVKVVSKAGYSGWWVLVSVIPVVNFAFSDWPVLREVRALRSERTGWPGGRGPGHGGAGPWAPEGWGGGPPPSASGPGGPAVRSAGGDRPEEEAPLPPFSPGDAGGPGVGSPRPGDVRSGPPSDAETTYGTQALAGWYPGPDGRLRYWDGSTWTDHFA
jgi:hypothetical protein